jgi:parallel beta-helix repeat protein
MHVFLIVDTSILEDLAQFDSQTSLSIGDTYVENWEKTLKTLGVLLTLILFSAVLLYNGPLGKSATSTILVPDSFLSIQAAVDAANSGDTVFVKAGVYRENVVVNKSISLMGEDASATIIEGSVGGGNFLSITANNVTVAGFTFKSSIDKCDTGIVLTGSNFCNISGNVITECYYGVVLDVDSTNNLLFGNFVEKSHESGISCLSGARCNEIVNNTVFRCGLGIYVSWSANESMIFHNSFITNDNQVKCFSSPNTWDGGYPSGGNYWTDYMGLDLYNGPSQDTPGSDGIGDTPYVTNDYPNIIDRYPFFVSGHETTVRFHLEPSSLTVRKGQTFNITVYLDNVPEYPGFVGLQFNITWDPAVLNGVGMDDVVFHSVTPKDQQDNIWRVDNRVTAGFASYAYLWCDMSTAFITGYCPIWGNHSLATIALKAVGEGTTAVKVKSIIVAGSQLQTLVYILSYGGYDESQLNHTITGSTVDVKPRNPGDINGDNRVDVFDELAVAEAFGTRLGQPNYNEMADQNGDSRIDITDSILVANNFGKTYS